MRPRLPQAPKAYNAEEEANFREAVQRMVEDCFARQQSVEMAPGAYIYARSPDGERWQISVSNAGAIVVTAA